MQPSDESKCEEEGVRYPEWQNIYHQALVELDKEKLSASVAAAETVIHRRLRALHDDAGHRPELEALQSALIALKVIRRELTR